MPEADTDHRPAQTPRLLGEGDREPAAAGQEPDRFPWCAGHAPSSGGLAGGLVLQPEVPFDALPVVAHLTDVGHVYEVALVCALADGRLPQVTHAAGDVAIGAGPGAKQGPVADVDVVDDPHLPGQDDVAARAAGARDADLGD